MIASHTVPFCNQFDARLRMPKVMSLDLNLLLEDTPCQNLPSVTIVTNMVNARSSSRSTKEHNCTPKYLIMRARHPRIVFS